MWCAIRVSFKRNRWHFYQRTLRKLSLEIVVVKSTMPSFDAAIVKAVPATSGVYSCSDFAPARFFAKP